MESKAFDMDITTTPQTLYYLQAVLYPKPFSKTTLNLESKVTKNCSCVRAYVPYNFLEM